MNVPSAYGGGPLLILDGSLPDAEVFSSLRSSQAPLIAADGAALQLCKLGIRPDLIVGDLDGISSHLNDPFFRDVPVLQLPDQEEYDGAKSLQWIIDEGFRSVTVLGAGGGMLDHVLNNFSLLARHADRLLIALRDDASAGYFVTTDLALTAQPGERISLIPMPCANLTTQGLAWNLTGEELALGLREGASNRAVAEKVSLTVHRGCVILFHYPVEDTEPH